MWGESWCQKLQAADGINKELPKYQNKKSKVRCCQEACKAWSLNLAFAKSLRMGQREPWPRGQTSSWIAGPASPPPAKFSQCTYYHAAVAQPTHVLCSTDDKHLGGLETLWCPFQSVIAMVEGRDCTAGDAFLHWFAVGERILIPISALHLAIGCASNMYLCTSMIFSLVATTASDLWHFAGWIKQFFCWALAVEAWQTSDFNVNFKHDFKHRTILNMLLLYIQYIYIYTYTFIYTHIFI